MVTFSRFAYLLRSALLFGVASRRRCPGCKHQASRLIERKWAVTSLRQCSACRLKFRTPTTTAAESAAFYQDTYRQGFTTEMPDDEALGLMQASRFRGTAIDYSPIVRIMQALGAEAGSRILDFGCSWGYGSWQLREAGFDVRAYEVSTPRSRYAEQRMGVSLVDPQTEPAASYDFFFSSHVIEHVPNPMDMLETGLRLLKPGGVFVALTPNGSSCYRAAASSAWSRSWGLVHPQLICEEWVAVAAGRLPSFVAATPIDSEALRAWRGENVVAGDLVGPELLFAIRAGEGR
jgi:2-polyprenyl-3-methyl-5-hydroxy-6-metoxy-1,4-benzoquinol methylase